jgi:hypothetical protein
MQRRPLTDLQRGLVAVCLSFPLWWLFYFTYGLRTCWVIDRGFALYYVVFGPALFYQFTLLGLAVAFCLGFLIRLRRPAAPYVLVALGVLALAVGLLTSTPAQEGCSPI